jgi:malate synthase
MADFEDASAPTWNNQIEGRLNLRDAVDGTIGHTGPDGRDYRLAVLGSRPNQIARRSSGVTPEADDLLAIDATPGSVTDAGVRNNVEVACRYLEAWLGGRGAVAINNLMEDTATAEISRAQLWQWIRHGSITRERVQELLAEQLAALAAEGAPHAQATQTLFERMVLADALPEFLTLAGTDLLEGIA